jgi:tRNA-2-methylthio-N6-dimethylallyladenosine synthase
MSRTYQIRTHGCQMNVHDSERLAGLLETAGYERADGATPDVVVFNTCAVRENADNKLYGSLGNLLPTKNATPGMQIAVGGCLAQKDKDTILKRAPWVDVVFGTHNVGSLPVLLERARIAGEAQVEIKRPGDLPVQPADPAGLGVRGLGLDQRGLQQHLHLLHRPRPSAARRPTGGRGTSWPRSRLWWPRACRR